MLSALYKTKAELKKNIGQSLCFVETSFFGPEYKSDGSFCVVGPSPDCRKWYATVIMKNNIIDKVN